MPNLDQFRRHVAERIDNPIAAERPIVREVVEITAVCEEALAATSLRIYAPCFFPNRLIDPIPDAAADERGIGVDEIPILLQVADGIAHRVSILAHDERLARAMLRLKRLVFLRHAMCARLLVAELAALFDPLDRRIHRRVYVRVLVAALPVDRARGINLPHRRDSIAEAVAVSSFVAHRPKGDGRIVAVEHGVALVALDDRMVPLLESPNTIFAVTRLVPLDVCLGDHIDAVAVAKVIPEAMVGIVASADGIDVELLEERDVLQHVVETDGAAVLGVRLVAVHALHLDRHSVHEESVADDFLLLEADLLRADVAALLHNKRVEIGVFCAPEARQGGKWKVKS